MIVTEAFQVFKSELELPDRKQKEAASAQQELREKIAANLNVPSSFLTGSYARHTKIFPLNDIDVFLVRNAQRIDLALPGTSGILPDAALTEVADAVRRSYPLNATVKKQNRSVNVQIQGVEFGFDLTPAWWRNPNGYWIPDRSSGNWIPSDPDAHAAMMTKANEQNGGKLKPLVKMAKSWNRHNYDRISSFHIELICTDIFSRQNIGTYQVGMATFLVHLPNHIGQVVFDPIYGVSRVDKELTSTELLELQLRVASDGQRAVHALTLENEGNQDQALLTWKEIFLSGFPQ